MLGIANSVVRNALALYSHRTGDRPLADAGREVFLAVLEQFLPTDVDTRNFQLIRLQAGILLDTGSILR